MSEIFKYFNADELMEGTRIAQVFYKDIPDQIVRTVRGKLPEDLLAILGEFNENYGLESKEEGSR